jgi:membrane protease YdiL (CAAX protease family)
MKKWFKNTEGQVRSGWKLILAFGLMNILTGLFSIPVLIVGSNWSTPIDVLADNPFTNLFLILTQLLGVIVSVLICLKKEKKKWKDVGITSLRSQGNNLLLGLFLGASSIVFITMILLVTKQITLVPAKITLHFLTEICLFFVSFIFVALNEELFFRGYVISALKQTKSYPIIYIVSSLVFGFAHLGNPNVHLLGIVNVFLISFLFAYMFIQTKTLWMSMGYHLTWNFFQGNILGFNVSGTKGNGFFHIKSSDNIWTGGSFGIEASVWTTVVILLGFLITKFYIERFFTSRTSHEIKV